MVWIGRRAGEFGNATANRIGATGNEHAERVKIEQFLARQQRERRARPEGVARVICLLNSPVNALTLSVNAKTNQLLAPPLLQPRRQLAAQQRQRGQGAVGGGGVSLCARYLSECCLVDTLYQ